MRDGKTNTAVIRKVLHYAGRYRLQALCSLLLAALVVALTLYLPIVIGEAIDLIVEPGRVNFAAIAQKIVRMAVMILVTAAAQWLMNDCNNRIAFGMVRDIRSRAFAHLMRLPLRYVDSHPGGDIISRLVADVDQLSDGLLMGFTQLFTGVMTILGTLFFMFRIHPRIALVVVVVTPLSLFVAGFIAKKTHAMFREQSETRGEMTAHIDEMIGGQKVVQAFGYEPRAEQRFDEINKRLQRCSLRAIFFSSLTNPATRFVNGLVYAGVGVFGALTALSGGISVGQLSCFLSYANQYTKPFNEISGVVTELQNALTCAARVFELIEEPEQIPDVPGARVLGEAEGAVAFENVDFSYSKQRPLIENLNLAVRPGQRVAIVGPTG